MNKPYSLRLVALFFLPGIVLTARADPPVWQRWEQTLTSTRPYANPYRDLTLAATFTGPGGATFTTNGFWEKDQTFKIRAAFPASGQWTWQTTCSDPRNLGLHRQRGTVTVAAYAGPNLLYQHGFLTVSADRRSLAHADGTPFLWMGDTAWEAFRKATPAEWRAYVDNRAAKGFSVIHVHATSYTAPEPNFRNEVPFTGEVPTLAYWRELDDKVEYANQRGIVLLVVGLGASGKGSYLPAMNTPEFARYLTGRLAGNFAVLSPSMDAPYDERNDRMGTLLDAATAHHLITQHVGTVAGAAEAYHGKGHLDFTALQSGHHDGKTADAYAAAHDWTRSLYQARPVKPVINSEAVYDGRGNNEGNNWREQDARKLGYLGWLSGALGYTYGAGETDRHVTGGNGGLFRFNQDSLSPDYWRNVVDWPSATQMTHLKTFFAALPWWRLQPAPDLIKNQPTGSALRGTGSVDPLRKMALARSAEGDLLVAYLPENREIRLDLSGLKAGLTGQWFNPVTGRYRPVSQKIGTTASETLVAPGAGDWVLVLKTNAL